MKKSTSNFWGKLNNEDCLKDNHVYLKPKLNKYWNPFIDIHCSDMDLVVMKY